ncbi:hypothetical protein K9M78_02990 [Candidatus Bipolaricaulota bacterium]|nr:hypothetical protein [Candidatus Bipolaricaulota bacterium]
MFSRHPKTKTFVLVAVLFVGIAIIATSQTSTAVTTRVRVSNTSCKGPVGISKFTFQRGGFPIGLKVFSPARSVELDQTRTFTFELNNRPTAVAVSGRDDREREFSVQVEMGEREEYRCGQISAFSEGEQPPEEDQHPQPGQGRARLPSRLQGISPGSSPQEVLNQLSRSGAELEIQGSRNNPKLGNVADPMLIGSLGSGFTATAYWINGPGQLRAVATWDRPSSPMVLLVVSSSLNFCASVLPTGGGIEVSCDAPASTEPLTTIGNAPVPGNTFLVVVVKLSGPAQQYVLSLSG